MKTKIIFSIKNFFRKIWKIVDKDDVLTESEKLAFDIFNIALTNDQNIKYLSPNFSDKRYILTKSYLLDNNVDTFIILNSQSNRITIVNHKYRYDISLPVKTCNLMSNMFDDEVEKERELMEERILNNITNSLDIVLQQFKEKMLEE